MQDLQKHRKLYTSFYPRRSEYEVYVEKHAGFFVSVWKKQMHFWLIS